MARAGRIRTSDGLSRERAQAVAVTDANFGDTARSLVGGPDVRAVKGHPGGEVPASKVPSMAPSLAWIFVTVLAVKFEIHMLLPSSTASPVP